MLKCLINDSCVVHNGHPTHKGMLADIIKKSPTVYMRSYIRIYTTFYAMKYCISLSFLV